MQRSENQLFKWIVQISEALKRSNYLINGSVAVWDGHTMHPLRVRGPLD